MNVPPQGVSRWRRHLTGPAGAAAALAWGFMEGMLFFIVPDVLLTLTALFDFKSAWRQTLLAVAGSLAAGAVLFTWAVHSPENAARVVTAVPFVRPAMVERVRSDLAEAGPYALLRGPLSGIPYKLYAVEAPAVMGLGAFLAISVPARLERLVTGLLLFGAAGWFFRRGIQAHPRRAAVGHMIYWIVVYACYWIPL